MGKCNETNWELIVAILSLIVAIFSIFLAISSLKVARKATILSILNERAKEANSHYKSPEFISPIIIAQQQLDEILIKKLNLKGSERQFYIDMFYLTLHTSIRIILWKEPTTTYSSNETYMRQIKDAQSFLKKSHEKWD